jgi:hypothetical protein
MLDTLYTNEALNIKETPFFIWLIRYLKKYEDNIFYLYISWIVLRQNIFWCNTI